MAERRSLRFANYDQMLAEADRLAGGYERAGEWSLGQVCDHLATTFELLLRNTHRAGGERKDEVRERFFSNDAFPDGGKVPIAALDPSAEIEDSVALAKFRSALERFRAYDGPLPSHFYLGSLTREEWDRFHRMHAAHHFGFLVPVP